MIASPAKNIYQTLAYYFLGITVCLLLVGYGRVRLNKILNLRGDTTQVLNFAKSAIDGYGFRFNPSLGYPGVQDNLYWPTFDFTGRLLLLIFSFFTKSAELSYHLLYIFGVCLMASGMLYGFSRLSFRPWLSLVGTCAFIATPFFSSRVLGHDFLSLYYGAAFGGTLSVLVATLDNEETLTTFLRRPTTWLLVWFSATSGLYYGFFACMFICLGGLMNTAWQRRWTPMFVALALAPTILLLTLVSGYGTGLTDVLAGRIPQVARAPFEQIELGLNPAEAVASLAVLPGLAWTLEMYRVVLPMVMGVKGLYEWPSAILCLVIFSAPVTIAVLSRGAESPARRWLNLVQVAALFITFGMLYAIRGGIAFYFNLLISGNIRGTDRIMPFLTFFAILLVCAFVERVLDTWRKRLGWPIATVVAVVLLYGAWPNVGALARKQQLILSNKVLQDSIASTRRMLLAKDAASISTVLQLPHIAWPEQPPVRSFDPYAHQNAYILDRAGATTHWSYGSASTQPAFKTVQTLVTDHATSGLVQGAKDLGFDGILIEKAAYASRELAELKRNIEGDLAGGCNVFDDDFRTLYRIGPGASDCLK